MRSVTKQNADLNPILKPTHTRGSGASPASLSARTQNQMIGKDLSMRIHLLVTFLVAGLTTLQQHNTALMFIRIRVIEAKIRSPCEIIIKRKITINPDWDQADYTRWTLGRGVRSNRDPRQRILPQRLS